MHSTHTLNSINNKLPRDTNNKHKNIKHKHIYISIIHKHKPNIKTLDTNIIDFKKTKTQTRER
jgi:hypothetical protein